MLYFILGALCLGLVGAALYFFIRSCELSTHLRQAEESWRVKEDGDTSELSKLEKIRHIQNARIEEEYRHFSPIPTTRSACSNLFWA